MYGNRLQSRKPTGTALLVFIGIIVGVIILWIIGLIQRLKEKTRETLKEEVPKEVSEETEWSTRDWIFLVFLLNFFINIGIAIYAGYSLPWKLLGSSSSIVAFTPFYSVFLGFCSLLIVYWVAEDGHEIEKLKELILEKRKK